MSKGKVAITLDAETLRKLDRLVRSKKFRSRSEVIREAIDEKIERVERGRLARECAKLDPEFERSLAEEVSSEDSRVFEK